MSKNAVSDWSTTASSNTDIGGINIDEGCAFGNINNAVREAMSQLKTYFDSSPWMGAEATIASATTSNLGGASGHLIKITGTTAITSFGSSGSTTNPLYYVRFTGALTLTHHATNLILPGSADITTADGDAMIVEALTSSTWKVLVYQRVSGAPLLLSDDSVTNAKLANMSQATIKGRASGAGTGDPTDLTATQATALLNSFVGDSGSGGTKGLVPAPASGDATKFLRGDGTFASAGGSTLMTAQATTSGTSFGFTGIPSTAQRVTVMLNSVSLSGTDTPLIQLGTSGGYVTSGYDAVGVGYSNAIGTVNYTAGFGFTDVGNATYSFTGEMTFVRQDGNTWIGRGQFKRTSAQSGQGTGYITLSGTLDRVRLVASGSNTFDAGSINVMYE